MNKIVLYFFLSPCGQFLYLSNRYLTLDVWSNVCVALCIDWIDLYFKAGEN